jgi:hypothetical protein
MIKRWSSICTAPKASRAPSYRVITTATSSTMLSLAIGPALRCPPKPKTPSYLRTKGLSSWMILNPTGTLNLRDVILKGSNWRVLKARF